MGEKLTEHLQRQISELTSVHKGLTEVIEHDAETSILGTLEFVGSADGLEDMRESFDVELIVPHSFPEHLPQTKEIGGRIAIDYDHLFPGGTMCLGVPIEQRRVFLEQPSLLGYVERLVVPYLYGYCYWTKHGIHPFDEAAHGCEGILDHYVDMLELTSAVSALSVICFLFEHGYRGHHDCPCGSGKRVRACHGPKLRTLHDNHTPETIRNDFEAIFLHCWVEFQEGKISLPKRRKIQLVRLLERSYG